MPNEIPYKSFCWALGTTSFRTKDFNKTIEEQLALLDGFWALPENQGATWSGDNNTQARYYDYMKAKEFVVGSAKNKPKDAREKTSGLVDIGIIDENRKLTEAGRALLGISQSNDFTSDNFFQIPKDSFLYLRQLLKTYNNVDGSIVRPFIVLLYVLSKVEFLSLDEFTYLLPLCTSYEYTEQIIEGIQTCRNNTASFDDIIINRLLEMDNYQAALKKLLDNTVTESLICEIGLNRKSRNYDKTYLRLYDELYSVFVNQDNIRIPLIFSATKNINIGKWWRRYLFNTSSEKAIEKNPVACLKHTAFAGVSTESEFKTVFFKTMHLFKAKATLSDYLDLNRRYIRTTDIILFEDSNIKLDIIPKHFFNSIADELYNYAYKACDILFANSKLVEIADCLVINEKTVIEGVNAELGTNVTTIGEARNVLEDNRYRRLQHLIDTKFTDEIIVTLLGYFESRNDAEIKSMVTENADIPTIFEYVLGILWYKISERQGKILDYMKLSLDADLLPKTHAAGGEADIVYEYPETEYYPAHTLLLEATLADNTNQRRMEMEPVSRHLGRHLIRTGNLNSYCVFATTYLDINVIADFRGRKHMPFYDTQDYTKSVDGMKIISLKTSELKTIIDGKKNYKQLYQIFNEAYISNLPPHIWYEECIKNLL